MNRGRIGPAVVSAAKRVGASLVWRWAWGGLLGGVALTLVAAFGWREAGWRDIGLHAGVFVALAAVLPNGVRKGDSSVIDLSVAIFACLLELAAESSVAEACVGVVASAAGWSLGRGALAVSRLFMAGPGASSAETEAAAVTWFAALQRTPPAQFDWIGLERWMRAHPAHRDAYERVEAVWFAEPAESGSASLLRDAVGGFSRVAAVSRLGMWLVPSYANRVLVFSAAVVLSAVAVYA